MTRLPTASLVARAVVLVAAPCLLVRLAARAEAQQVVEPLRYHVTSWVQWEDQRVNLGDAWLEGPAGMQFDLSLWFADLSQFDVRFWVSDGPDSTLYRGFITSRQKVGRSTRDLPLWEEDRYVRAVVVRRGEVALLSFPFAPDSGESATLNVRIAGPEVPPPDVPLAWEIDARGVRIAHTLSGSMRIEPRFYGGSMFVRVGLATGGPTRTVHLPRWSWPLLFPGQRDSVVLSASGPVAPREYACVAVLRWVRSLARQGGPATQLGRGCFAAHDPWAPISIALTSGETVRVQMVPAPLR